MRYLRLYVFLLLGLFSIRESHAATLDDIWERGVVNCGVDEQHYGFAYLNERGEWTGFEVDFCRALATAVLGDPNKVSFVPLNAQTRFGALKNGSIDILLRSTTWTYTRDTVFDFDFPAVVFYDELGVLAHKSIGIKTLREFKEGTICVAAGTTTLETIREHVQAVEGNVRIKMFNSREGLNNFFFSGQCDLYSADMSALHAILTANAPNPDDYVFLDGALSKEPLSPVVRGGEREWHEVVKWLIYGVMAAEERGITKANIKQRLDDNSSTVRFMLGQTPGIGRPLRLNDKWLYDVVATMGNYGEIYERNLGEGSSLKMKRGLNALWRDGGLMYPMPMR